MSTAADLGRVIHFPTIHHTPDLSGWNIAMWSHVGQTTVRLLSTSEQKTLSTLFPDMPRRFSTSSHVLPYGLFIKNNLYAIAFLRIPDIHLVFTPVGPAYSNNIILLEYYNIFATAPLNSGSYLLGNMSHLLQQQFPSRFIILSYLSPRLPAKILHASNFLYMGILPMDQLFRGKKDTSYKNKQVFALVLSPLYIHRHFRSKVRRNIINMLQSLNMAACVAA